MKTNHSISISVTLVRTVTYNCYGYDYIRRGGDTASYLRTDMHEAHFQRVQRRSCAIHAAPPVRMCHWAPENYKN